MIGLALLAILSIILIYVFTMNYFISLDEEVWNNGKCPDCGECWKFERNSIDGKIYRCKNGHQCEICIWVDDNYDEWS